MKSSVLFPILFTVLFLVVLPSPPLLAQWSTYPNFNNAICTASDYQGGATIVSDGAGGAIITWQDKRGGSDYDIYAQRINAAGTVQWTGDGVAICTASSDQQLPTIVSDGAGGAIIAWPDSRNGNSDIYAQRINAAGTVQWTGNGVAICTASDYQYSPTIVSDGAGGAIITWTDFRNGNNDIYAQRINSAGTVQWTSNGVAICTASDNQVLPTIVNDGTGGAIITWRDSRNGNYDIYAQRINADSTVQWTSNGVAICVASNDQDSQTLVTDGAGGAIITWRDRRGSVDDDIYAQRINATGIVQWTSDGVAICTASGDQNYQTIVSDGVGGAIITWTDYRGELSDIYAQRISATGNVRWTSDGLVICAASLYQYSPTIASDGAGGAIITWSDGRNGSYFDIYAQRINAAGTVRWTSDGVVISMASGNQYHQTIVSDGAGGAIITWMDTRGGSSYDIYAQKVDRYAYLGDASAHVAGIKDVANDQGGRIRVMWDASYLDVWPNSTVRLYTLWIGTKPSGIVGKMVPNTASIHREEVSAQNVTSGGIYWQSAGSVAAHWLSGYSAVVTTYADSGLQGIPMYYFQVSAQAADSTVFWTSNVDSGFSIDNIPPVGISGAVISPSGNNRITLLWNKDRVDPDLMAYQIYRATTTGFALDKSSQLALAFDTTYTDESTSPGQTYYYRVAAVDVHGNLGTPSNELNQQALAVTLTSFAASSSRLCAELHWMTTTETDNEGFEIERKCVGQTGSSTTTWQSIGFVVGASTSLSPKQYGYVDRTVIAGTYDYRIKQIQRDGSFSYSPTIEVMVGMAPKEFALSQNYPNPFNPTTNIEFTIPQDGRVKVTVYNTLGEEVATLLDQNMGAGVFHRVSFDATHQVSGVYLVKLQFGEKQLVKKMLLLK